MITKVPEVEEWLGLNGVGREEHPDTASPKRLNAVARSRDLKGFILAQWKVGYVRVMVQKRTKAGKHKSKRPEVLSNPGSIPTCTPGWCRARRNICLKLRADGPTRDSI